MDDNPISRILYDECTSPAHLERVFHLHIKEKTARGRDGVEAKALAANIGPLSQDISKRLRSGNYRFTSYRELLVSKGAGKYPRVLSVPTARDRIALKAIASVLQQIYPDSRGTRPQLLVQKLSDGLNSRKYNSFLRLDIKEFYPNIKHDYLLDILRKAAIGELVSVAESAIKTNTLSDNARRSRTFAQRGVPQGLSISNILAEISLMELDRDMKNDPDVLYLRYVDDIMLLCDGTQTDILLEKVKSLVKPVGLCVHPLEPDNSKSRSGSVSEEIGYLGYTFHPSVISVRKSSVASIEASLARLFAQYAYQIAQKPGDANWKKAKLDECLWNLNLRITGCTFESVSRGWLAYFSQLTDLRLLKQRDATVNRLIRRFGMPKGFKPKSFSRAYWHITHPNDFNSSYIPSFDRYTVSQMRDLLCSIFHIFGAEDMSDTEVRSRFSAEIGKRVRDLDKDVRPTS